MKDQRVRTGYVPDEGRCHRCQKWRYISRAMAKKAAKRFHPGDRMSAYQCPVDTNFWHYGHLPEVVRDGSTGRAELRSNRTERKPS